MGISCSQQCQNDNMTSHHSMIIEKSSHQKTTQSHPIIINQKQLSSHQVEKISDEYSVLDFEIVPKFALNKSINDSLQPRSNRFRQDLEDEVKRRIKEIHMEELQQQEQVNNVYYQQEQQQQNVNQLNPFHSVSFKGDTIQQFSFRDVQTNQADVPIKQGVKIVVSQQIQRPLFMENSSGSPPDKSNNSHSVNKSVYSERPHHNTHKISNFADNGSQKSAPISKKGEKGINKLMSDIYFAEGGRMNRYERSKISSYQKKQGILKFKTHSIRQIYLKTRSLSTKKTSKTTNSKKVRFTQETNYNYENKDTRSQKKRKSQIF